MEQSVNLTVDFAGLELATPVLTASGTSGYADELTEFMDFSMTEDVIIIDDKTNGNLTSGGGFGRTVMLKDGTLVSPYSYMWADADVVRMVENEEYLNAEVFNKYGSMLANPVTFESRSKTKELLRMSFAVTWGFNELMNKAGIRTDIVRWRLPESFK